MKKLANSRRGRSAATAVLLRSTFEVLEERRLLYAGPQIQTPAIPGGEFEMENSQALVLHFDQPVTIADKKALLLNNLTYGITVPMSKWTVNAADNGSTQRFDFNTVAANYAAHAVWGANYEAILNADLITNSTGDHLDGNANGIDDRNDPAVSGDDGADAGPDDFRTRFFFFPGDANHDRTVNIDDYVRIDQGSLTHLTGYSNGDFNYDGKITIDDWTIIDQTIGTRLPEAPTTPNTLAATAGRGYIHLFWTAPEGWENTDIDGYGIWRSTDGGVTFQMYNITYSPGDTTFTDDAWAETLPDGVKYTYLVRAHSASAGYSEASNKYWAVTNLPAPDNLTATPIDSSSVQLSWEDNSNPGATSFEVCVTGPDDAQWTEVVTTAGPGPMSYTVIGLDPETEYSFEVLAKTSAQTSAWSLPANATTRAAAPELYANPLSPTKIQLSWADPSQNPSGYHVERSTDSQWGNGDDVTFNVGLDDSTIDTNCVPGATYHYRMWSYNASGSSDVAGPIDATIDFAAPSALAHTLLSSSGLTLHWADNTYDESGFIVRVTPAGGTAQDFNVASQQNAGSMDLPLTNLDPATSYSIAVGAKTDTTFIAWSQPLAVTTLLTGQPTAPSDVTVAADSDGHTMHLTWTDNSDNESGFTIEQSQDDGETWEPVAYADEDETSADVTDLYSLTKYQFRLIANAPIETGNNNLEGEGEEEEGDGMPASPPSDPADALTDYGNGLVYFGYPPSDPPLPDEVHDGVQASWSGGPSSPDGQLRNDTYTLTLSNLPAHYGLSIDAGQEAARNADVGTQDVDHFEMRLGSATYQRDVLPNQEPDWFFPKIVTDHTGSSATITFTGTGWESGDSWTLARVWVNVLRYRVSASPDVFTIGAKDMVQLSAAKEDGTPASGVQLSIESARGVEPTSSEVTTNNSGTALAELKGMQLGGGSFVLAAGEDGGGKVKINVNVAKPELQFIWPSDGSIRFDTRLHVGQMGQYTISLKKANGLAWANKDVNISIENDTPNPSVILLDNKVKTGADGRAKLVLTARAPNLEVGLNTYLVARVKEATALMGIDVAPVKLIVPPQVHPVLTVKAKKVFSVPLQVVDVDTGEAVTAVEVQGEVIAGPGGAENDMVAGSSVFSDANGIVLVRFRAGNKLGDHTVAGRPLWADRHMAIDSATWRIVVEPRIE